MSLTLTTLLTEFYARGLADLNDSGTGTTRATRWLNDAAHEIDGLADWPYLMGTQTGTVPMTISDLGVVESVTDVGSLSPLAPSTRGAVRAAFADLTTVGSASCWYFTSQTTLTTYPVTTATVTVDYWKVSTDMSAGSDVPLMPDRYRMGIVHYAVAAALADRGDFTGSQLARQDGDRVVSQMLAALVDPQRQGASRFASLVGEDS